MKSSVPLEDEVRNSIVRLLGRLAGMIPLLEAQRLGAELYGSPRLNAFDLFAPGENDLSRLAEDLVDPLGVHGQGALFLNAFLAATGLPKVEHGSAVRIRREALTSQGRRIDLLIETADVLVGIENKPWASQQPNQLGHYLEEIRNWAGSKAPLLVFLSDQEPETAREDVLVLPFSSGGIEPSFCSILEECLPQIRSSRAKTHVEEFTRYLKQQFGDGLMNDPINEVFMDAVRLQASDRSHRKAVAALLLSSDLLHQTVINEIGDFFLTLLRELHGDFEVEDHDSLYDALSENRVEWRLRRPSWPPNLAITFEAGQKDFRQVYYGVLAPNSASKDVDEEDACSVREVVEKALAGVNGGKPSNYYAWWGWTTARDWDYELAARAILDSPSGRVEDNPEIKALAERVVALAGTVERALQGTVHSTS